MVIFSAFKEAEACRKKIGDLKTQLNIKSEFKFNKSHPTVKESFFHAIKRYDFSVRAIVIDKNRIISQRLRSHNAQFYRYVMKLLLEKTDDYELKNAIIKIDAMGSKDFKQKLRKYLTEGLGVHAIKKLTLVDSKRDHLIQLADMVIGAISRSYSGREDAQRWVKMLGKKVDLVLESSALVT
ncbi:DUF3800 domain-containing protein [Coxiella burnetii]|uniref:DUF3800 domain-containing protein n=1 Tax=Coxiella burnetii TaxID=777 RepID=UPI0021766A97|nr:DUF3800 domain-containing protein [Coxiella burnetii]